MIFVRNPGVPRVCKLVGRAGSPEGGDVAREHALRFYATPKKCQDETDKDELRGVWLKPFLYLGGYTSDRLE